MRQERFEREFSRWLGADYTFAFWKGRVALYAILRALGIEPGDEIIIPGYTCIAVVRVLKYLGAVPVYVDIDPQTYNIDVARVPAAISAKTRLIIAQHTYGIPARIDHLLTLASEHGLELIEDACLAVGSRYRGDLVGTAAKASYWSMQWSKTLTTGYGGMASTSDAAIARKIQGLIAEEAHAPTWKESKLLAAMRFVHSLAVSPENAGRAKDLYRKLSSAGWLPVNPPGSSQVKFSQGFFKLMGSSQAKAGLRQLAGLELNLAHRRKMAALYNQLLAERGWPILQTPSDADPVLVRYPVRVQDKTAAVRLAQERRLEIGTWFDSPLHQCSEPLESYDYRRGMCPVAERIAGEVVNLPTHPRVSETHARALIDLIDEIGPARSIEIQSPVLHEIS